jgi:hypothetical protein
MTVGCLVAPDLDLPGLGPAAWVAGDLAPDLIC